MDTGLPTLGGRYSLDRTTALTTGTAG
jgi:hypothetical protein